MYKFSHTYELHHLLDGDYEEHLNNNNESLLLIEFNKLENWWVKKLCDIPWGFVKTVQKVAKVKDKELFGICSEWFTWIFIVYSRLCMNR